VATRKISVEITGDSRDLERAFGRSAATADTFGKKVSRAAGIAGLAIGGGLALAAKAGFDELAEGQKVAAQTQAALKSTGGAANVSAGHIEELAGRIQKLSGADDEAIQAGENLLLTFTNVQNRVGKGNDIFDQAVSVMADMSTALGQDATQSATQLGKALQDPARGLTALRKVGVTFTEAQEKQIKQMQKSGDVAGAQKVILAELTKEFGGSAKAAGETLPGKLAIARGQFENLTGQLMEGLIPAITVVAEELSSLVGFLSEHEGLTKALVAGVAGLAAAMMTLSVATKIAAAAQLLFNIALNANPISLIVLSLVALGAAVVVAYKKFETFRNVVNAVADFVRRHWEVFLAVFTGGVGLAVAKVIQHFGTIKGAVGDVVRWVKARWDGFMDFFKKLPGRISSVASGMWDGITSAFRGAVNAVIDMWNGLAIPGFSVDPLGKFGPTISTPRIDFPNIPHLAGGGHVSRSGLAVVHRGETITPAAITDRGGGPAVVVNITGPVYGADAAELARKIAIPLNDVLVGMRRRGRTLPGYTG
jgi:hypothetical protein